MSPFEAEILQTLWKKGNLTSTQIQKCLESNGKRMHIATVCGLLNRLIDAGYATREVGEVDSKQRYLYSARYDEKETAKVITLSIIDHLEEVFGNDFHRFILSYV